MALLLVEHVAVRFGGVHAIEDVTLDVDAGHVTGLIGPNGAGKTTLFNVITGLQEPTRGRVVFDDRDITKVKAFKRSRMGIGRTFQRLETFGSLSVRENILVAAEARAARGDQQINPRADTAKILELIRLKPYANERADSLPTGLLRIVELGRALATRPKVLLLDEPSSGLNDAESDLLADLMLQLARRGLGVLLVEHHMELVMGVCERIHVLEFGRIIASGTPQEIQADPQVQAAYLGTGGTDDEDVA